MGWFSSSPADAAATTSQTASSSQDTSYKPLKREERKACWEARDIYFGCLDKNNILDAVESADAASKSCGKESALFEKDCASSWVIYFKQKRVADYNKAQQMKKLEAEGAVPLSEGTQQSKFKFW